MTSRLPAILAALTGLLVGLFLARRRVRRRAARSRAMGRTGHRKALKLLRRSGYRVLDTEVTKSGSILVDGEERTFSIRADALVRRRFRRYVAEFKGGAAAASPANRETRRQLLEYALVFRTRGILLVDAEAGRIHLVEFPRLRQIL